MQITQTDNPVLDYSYYGIYFSNDGARRFWKITCPCGVTVEYPVNQLPEIDTPHPCGNINHWTVKYDENAKP